MKLEEIIHCPKTPQTFCLKKSHKSIRISEKNVAIARKTQNEKLEINFSTIFLVFEEWTVETLNHGRV